jgi:hypothetical protein
MVWGLSEQPSPHALAKRLKRVSSLAGHPDRSINKVVDVMPVRQFSPLSFGTDHYTTSFPPDHPRSARQVFVRFTYGIVVNFQASREFPDAWQSLTGLHFLGRD